MRGRNPCGVASRNKPLINAKVIAIAVTVVLLGLLALVRQEIPKWRIGGTHSTPASSVAHVPDPFSCPSDGMKIAIIGDSHVAGSGIGGAEAAYGDVLQQALGGRVEVARYGVGGETAAGGEARWHGRDLPGVDLIILAYGTNDAAPRGWLASQSPVPVKDFNASLIRQIAGWRDRGIEVVLLAPPPGGSTAIARRLSPYREAAGVVGRSADAAVLDPANAFASCPSAQPVLAGDALHMNASGHQCLGRWLARQLCPPDR